MGSGVVVHRGEHEFLVTALHVARQCRRQPLIRRGQRWNRVELELFALIEKLAGSLSKASRGF